MSGLIWPFSMRKNKTLRCLNPLDREDSGYIFFFGGCPQPRLFFFWGKISQEENIEIP